MHNNILILYTELMPYNVVVIRELVKKGYCVHVVLYDVRRKTPYRPPLLDGVTYYNRSNYKKSDQLFNMVIKINPNLIWIAGWIDPLYTKVACLARKKLCIPVVSSSDTQWRGGKQWLNVLTSRFRHRRWFSHMFVAGEWQVKYARKLGFRPDQILMHNLSADFELFSKVDISSREKDYPKRLLYIGRFSPEKGLIYLLKAWQSIADRKGWKLTLIGNGPEREKLQGYPDVEVFDFMEQKELIGVMEKSGAFILPSIFEPWALVIHEAACAGLPILASDCCGATASFLKDGENGYLFTSGSVDTIRSAIEKLIVQPVSSLLLMGDRSRQLSLHITPEKVADTVLAILK